MPDKEISVYKIIFKKNDVSRWEFLFSGCYRAAASIAGISRNKEVRQFFLDENEVTVGMCTNYIFLSGVINEMVNKEDSNFFINYHCIYKTKTVNNNNIYEVC